MEDEIGKPVPTEAGGVEPAGKKSGEGKWERTTLREESHHLGPQGNDHAVQLCKQDPDKA